MKEAAKVTAPFAAAVVAMVGPVAFPRQGEGESGLTVPLQVGAMARTGHVGLPTCHSSNRELRSLFHQKAGMTLLWSEVLGSFLEGLAPPAGTEAAAPAGPGAGERLGCES
jgi:hypothetical protein